ncbi:helix-turn-helix domain-containing protein [Streptomyces griseoloalbus]|uniref:Transcriptional regulator with XRE-family HTH domain n=1 Tax=Streptomyces griseoloalbus TaxID=67303 RepID=A0A7W8BL04_9ACTN|nr:helix-turn-helix transcriptional regulator [Streptomyces albaduncus]MBB5123419.1 transcriptional regulator with XRE-family HTH domain [Streptomyces albaduncus]
MAEVNEELTARMRDLGLTQEELAEALNTVIEQITGRFGTVSVRTIHNFTSGRTRWPQARQRLALEAIFGCAATELGFVPHARATSDHPIPAHAQHHEEEPVLRREFLAATSAAVLSPLASGAPATASGSGRLGQSDVNRLSAQFALIIASDNRTGGTHRVEQAALGWAQHALHLQRTRPASQRVRGQLYGLAAGFMGSALWAAIDGGRLGPARQHLHEAVSLAGLSGDSSMQFRIWGHAGALYRNLGQCTSALAADEAAKRTRVARDPLYASLVHARTAVHHADLHDRQAALRCLGLAESALSRADGDALRPSWLLFYDSAEFHLLALTATTSLGLWDQAEAHAHHTLAKLRPDLKRNRALTQAYLAHAQLGQHEPGLAVATAHRIPAQARHGRTAHLLNNFGHRLHALAPNDPATRAWFEKELL